VQEDYGIVDRFVSDYLTLLDGRLVKLERLLAGVDDEATLVALLSLGTTSSMIGADDVVAAAKSLSDAVEACQDTETRAAFAQLQTAVISVRRSLANQGFSALPTTPPAVG